jgi:hypothetical protein
VRRTLAAAGLAAALAVPAAAQAPDSDLPLAQLVQDRIQPQTQRLLLQLVKQGRGFAIDGTPVFNGSDRFLPGKIALGLADMLTALPEGDPQLPGYLADFRKIAQLTIDDPNDSWGIYYYLSALNTLKARGRLEAAVDPLTLARLRVRLDWRSFVDADSYVLIDHPNNYYCVAFGIARLRQRLGWEGPEPAEHLLAALTAHYRRYSGAYGFADETDGEGRFDRYSVLLAAELAERFLETGGKPPPEALGWLRKSADVMLSRLNAQGEGFEYGRSLGPYGDSAVVEVLTAAAALDLLTPEEKALAYAFSTRAAKRYVDFWLDPRTGSVNLWDGGRRTDAYRGKFRILGENLSLAHQYVAAAALWDGMGYRGKTPDPGFGTALARLPARTVTWFAHGTYDRMLVTLRDRGQVIGLPLISGGREQHMHSPYFPIPFSPGMLASVADGTAPLLTPRFTLADGSVLMPLAYIRDAKLTAHGARTTITWRQSEMDRMGAPAPRADNRLQVAITYVFEPGRITRTDTYTPLHPLHVKELSLEFGSFSSAAEVKGLSTLFGEGRVRSFAVRGLADCRARPVAADGDYFTPNGPMTTVVACQSGAFSFTRPVTVSWILTYDPLSAETPGRD